MKAKLAFTISIFISTSIYHAEQSDISEEVESNNEISTSKDENVILVIGRAQQFYLDNATTVGTKTDTELLDIPLSAQVLTKQLIIDQAARDITDMYRSIAGVSEFSYSGVTFRGFRDDANVFYDGVRGDPFSGFSVPQLFNVERIEILKGPSAAIYGGGEPGGMINYVSKKPSFNRSGEVKITLGNYSLAGISAEVTDSISEKLAFRIGAFHEIQDSFRNNADEENTVLNAGLLYQISDLTTIDFTLDYVSQELGGHRLRGVPVDDYGNFLVDRSYNANEAVDFQNLEALVVQSNFKHEFSDNHRTNITLRYMDNARDQAYHESRFWVDVNDDGLANIEDGTIRREFRDQQRANEELSLTADFIYEFSIGNINHQLVYGGDYHDVDTEFDYLRARYEGDNVRNLNIFDLNYGLTDPSTYNLTDLNRDGVLRDRYSLYLQDLITLSTQWSIMLGARYDYFEEINKQTGTSYNDSDISLRTGITFKPDEDTSYYLNYSESFNPVSSNDFEESVGTLDPTTGDQIEVGIKKEWLDGQILTTLAYYQIDKENLVQNNPDYIDATATPNLSPIINFGLVESDGFEFVMVGDISDNLSITANYAYNDTVVSEGSSRNTSGDRFVNAPEHQAGVWLRYNLESINSSIAFGADYVSEQISFSSQKVKPFTVYDISWTSSWDNYLFSINIQNLFDKVYAVSGFSERNGHFPGAPREITAQLSYSF